MVDQDILPPTSASAPPDASGGARKKRRPRRMMRMWGRRIAGSRLVGHLIVPAIAGYLRFVNLTNPWVVGSSDKSDVLDHAPFICALWHGQHLMGPVLRPKGMRMTALFSKSADAELNARVARAMGLDTVRGSGGREGHRTDISKGGARALIKLKRVLDQGSSVAMIADIVHGTPRRSGQGIILLAKLSGRPIVPVAYASSRYKVIEKSWDKTTIPLPFGHAAALAAEPVFVPADADEAMIEAKRMELTDKLNAITARAYELAGAPR
jgi:lysophospholipid acyltransferase (LPLAT)-like uncharacterized protein